MRALVSRGLILQPMALGRSTDKVPLASATRPQELADALCSSEEERAQAPECDDYDVVLASDVLYSSALASSLSRAASYMLFKPVPATMLISHTLRFSVTWSADREPVLETFDSVLDSFLQSLGSLGARGRVVARRDEHSVSVYSPSFHAAAKDCVPAHGLPALLRLAPLCRRLCRKTCSRAGPACLPGGIYGYFMSHLSDI